MKKTKTCTFTNKLLLNSQRLFVSWKISGASQASNKPFLPTWLAVSSSEQPYQSESNSAKSSGVKLLKGSKLLKPEARRAIKDLDEWVHMSFILSINVYHRCINSTISYYIYNILYIPSTMFLFDIFLNNLLVIRCFRQKISRSPASCNLFVAKVS